MLRVDDIIISGNDVVGIKELNNHLMSTFKMKAMEHLTYFVGLEISQSKADIQVHQCKYAKDLIFSARLSNAKPFDTPIELNVIIGKNDGSPLSDSTSYRRVFGGPFYPTMTWPEICSNC